MRVAVMDGVLETAALGNDAGAALGRPVNVVGGVAEVGEGLPAFGFSVDDLGSIAAAAGGSDVKSASVEADTLMEARSSLPV